MDKPLAIVLAAGKGTRMKSDLPKVLYPVGGRPMIQYVLDALRAAGVQDIVVVVGYRADDVKEALDGERGVDFAEQTEQLGTGHAVQVCGEYLSDRSGPVVILTGDSPLTQSTSLTALLDEFRSSQPECILGTLEVEDSTGLGRIVRDESGEFAAIVEEKDATEEQRRVKEVNMSTYVFAASALRESLGLLSNDNQQSEYYITDCPGILKSRGGDVRALPVLKPCEALSVNTVEQVAAVEKEMRRLGTPCES